MTDREIEQKLAQALEKTAPKDIQGVLSRCEERKGTVLQDCTPEFVLCSSKIPSGCSSMNWN